jgi:hypothetical protein
MGSKNNPMARQTDVVVQKLKDEILIYDLLIHKAYCLNQTSAIVYQLCDGKHSVSDVSKELSKKLKSTVSEDLVWLAIDQLKQNNLLAESAGVEVNFNGLSRREAIRKAGLASMVALPLISSLAAPTAADAQSSATCDGVCGCMFDAATFDPAINTSCGLASQIEVFCPKACVCQVTGACGVDAGRVLCEGTCIGTS